MKNSFRATLVASALVVTLTSVPAFGAGPGVTDQEIVLGQSAVLEGPASALGLGMRAGLQACFSQVNEAGGIGGRKIRLLTKDDGYEPDRAIACARELISQENVLLLIGGVGTPTANVITPICEEAKVPFVGAFTGAATLRTPFKKYVVNVRASYGQEMEKLAQYLVDSKKLTRIACFHQNDGYGQAGLSGIQTALKKRNLELVATGNYERNTTAVKAALLDVKKGEPQAIVMVGTYKACAEFIKLARKFGLNDALFCNISFVGTKALLAEVGEAGEGVVISQVVPSPYTEDLPVLKEYQAALKKHQPAMQPDWISLEGFLAAKFFCQVAEKTGKELTRESFLATIQKVGTFDLGGLTLQFGPEDHQGLDAVFLTQIKGGQVVALP
ncbi:MAG: ABC transporter substrate-binding protein [Verrucomicrobia bacterium]|nr:ABC transporter substrate-binding protein [Verrucomicrobiota bacterium]